MRKSHAVSQSIVSFLDNIPRRPGLTSSQSSPSHAHRSTLNRCFRPLSRLGGEQSTLMGLQDGSSCLNGGGEDVGRHVHTQGLLVLARKRDVVFVLLSTAYRSLFLLRNTANGIDTW